MATLPVPKIAAVHNVFFQRKGETRCQQGTLHLTSHHLVFETQSATKTRQIAYSLLLNVTRMPSLRIAAPSGASSRIYPITFFQKDFDSFAVAFRSEDDQTAVFDNLKDCAVLSDVSQVYAFHYRPPEPTDPSGWTTYDFKKEFARQGIGSRSKAWRFTDINATYSFCSSYPSHMVVPSRISDTTLNYAAKYRSKERIPALTYLHWANHASITRSSQPMVGLKNARSIQDEKLIEAIFTSHHYAQSSTVAATDTANTAPQTVYGATSTNLIIDARPTTNAMANVAKGAGTENMEYYKGCKKSYLGIDNIHVMRDSLNKLTDALRESEPTATFGMQVESLEDTASVLKLSPTPVDATVLRKSMWLKHIQSLLEGSMSIVRNVHINSSHVLIHCSDGWDRTSQLAAIAQVCLDPYFRTFQGLAVLIEKDWLSFGHKFTDRGGQKGCEKYFNSKYSYSEEDDGDGTDGELEKPAAGGGGFDSQAAANAFWGFTKQLTANFSAATSSSSASHKGSHIKETSPVFQQFLDCLWQIMRQYPTRFEYSADYLIEVLKTAHECKYGTFLLNCDRQRLRPEDVDGKILPPLSTKTVSAWTYLLSAETRSQFANPSYQPALDDRDPKRIGTDLGVLIADARDVRYFERLFQKAEGDMNAALDKEADERRRAKDRLERAVRGGEESTNASLSNLKDATAKDPDPTIAVVGPGDVDPVLNPIAMALQSDSHRAASPTPGAVDLAHKGHVGPAKLAYKARQPRTVQPASDGPVDVGANFQGAADAANRMKNLFVGGWGKLQDAMASPVSTPVAVDKFDVPPRKSSVTDLGQTALQQDTPSRTTGTVSEMPLFAAPKHGSNPWTTSNGIRDEMHREHVSMRSRIHDSRTPATNTGPQSWSTSMPAAHDASQGQTSDNDSKKEASDPLGVL